ncbi:MAG: hypothetical protein AAGF19_04525 [Pseudomonadota bacterium]
MRVDGPQQLAEAALARLDEPAIREQEGARAKALAGRLSGAADGVAAELEPILGPRLAGPSLPPAHADEAGP